MKNQKKAYLFALTAIAFWSTIGSAFKITLRYLSPLEMLFFSSLVATVVLFITLAIRGKLALLWKTTAGDMFRSGLLGLLNPFLYYVVLLRAYDLLPAQEAGTLNYIWPLVLVLLSIPLLRQKIGMLSILAIFISFIGIIIISTHGNLLSFHFSNPTGVFLALGSAVFWSLFWIFNIKDKRDPVLKLFLNFLSGFLYTAVAMAFLHGFGMPSYAGLAGAVYIGLFEMGITFVLWLNALHFSATTARVSNLIYLSPFISLVLIHFAVGEKILLSTVAGLAFIVGGILLQQSLKR